MYDWNRPVRGLIFDLDDTLYLQKHYLDGAWDAVATAGKSQALDPDKLREALKKIAAQGSDQGKIIDRAVESIGAAKADVQELVTAFVSHQPHELPLLDGVIPMLIKLRTLGVPTAIVTDGSLATQRAKLVALAVESLVDAVVMSDEAGRQYRKPHPQPVLTALEKLDLPPQDVVMIGDRPTKDVASAAAAGVRAIRVMTGEYADAPDHPFTWRTAPTAPEAVTTLQKDGLLRQKD